MSKRHKKTKSFMSAGDDAVALYGMADALEAPRGKKPKGKHRRETHKRAYYDD